MDIEIQGWILKTMLQHMDTRIVSAPSPTCEPDLYYQKLVKFISNKN
jgi:hypothetical protein